jgi:hypothetical protein
MTSIFNALGPRHDFTFKTRGAYIQVGSFDVNNLSGAESFLIEFSTGGPILIDLSINAPYGNMTALANEIKSQIDAGAGVGVGSTIIYTEDQRLAFYDVADGYISTNIDDTSFTTFPLSNLIRQIGTYPSYEVIGIGNPSPPQAGVSVFKVNGLSDIYEILPGINEITLWTTSENPNTEILSAVLLVAWTNGVDGVVTNGTYEELMFEASDILDVMMSPPNIDQTNISIRNARAFALSGGATDLQKITKQQFSLKVPSGATGVYVYCASSTGNVKIPLTVSVAITSATR